MIRPGDIAVVVLAGGEGRRMGGDKPLRPYGETTLIGHALDLAVRYGGPVAVAVRDPTRLTGHTAAPCLVDDRSIEGPIAGLASALGFAAAQGAAAVLTLPCDTPHLPTDLAARLAGALAANAEVAMAVSGGRLHPTCALWRACADSRLPAYLSAGGRSLRGFAQACGMTEVVWSAEPSDPFANANTPGDLLRLQPARALLGA